MSGLPPGLTLNPTTGIISGIPTTVGTYNVSFRVTDANGLVVETDCCVITVLPPAQLPGNCRTTLYLWQHSAVPQVEITRDRNDDWTDCGTKGLKFFQGFKLDADTFGANKQIGIRDADTGSIHLPQPTPINHQGRQTKPYSFGTPFLAHSVRRESLDGVDWRKFGINYIWEPSPEFTYTWKTQRTAHGQSAFHYVAQMRIAYASQAPVTLTITAFDGTSPSVITLPSTGGVYQKIVVVPTFNKGLLYEYLFNATPEAQCGGFTGAFQLWKNDMEVLIGQWGRQGPSINYPLVGDIRGDQAFI